MKKRFEDALNRHDSLAIITGLTLIFLSVSIPSFVVIALIHLFFPIGLWVVPVVLGSGLAGHWFLNRLIPDEEKPPQLAAPKSGLERLKEQYALGEIDLEQLEAKTTYELYIQTHAIAPPALELPPPPKPVDRNAREAAKHLREVQDYWRANIPHGK